MTPLPLNSRWAIFVPGRPVPQGSKTAYVNKKTGRAVVVDKDTRLPNWRMKITAAALQSWSGDPLTGPVGIEVTFALNRPSSHYGTGKNAEIVKASSPTAPATMPDLDKLLRAVFDALTDARVWKDDGQVVWCRAAKVYVNGSWLQGEGVHITLGVIR